MTGWPFGHNFTWPNRCQSLRVFAAKLEAVCGSRNSPYRQWFSVGRSARSGRWRDVWQLFPGRAGAFEQQSAFESEWASIEPRASDLPFTLSPKGQITLKDGSTVSGAQLNYDWLRTDFEINPVGTVYGEGTAYPQTRGEANYNEGNPLIRVNIDTLAGYAGSGDAGLNFWVGHEMGHLTAANRNHDGTVADANAR